MTLLVSRSGSHRGQSRLDARLSRKLAACIAHSVKRSQAG